MSSSDDNGNRMLQASAVPSRLEQMISKESSGEQRIPLQTKSGMDKWMQQRMAQYSSAKEAFVLVTILLLAFVGGPALIFYFMSWILAGSLGTSGGGAAALAFNSVIYFLLCMLAAALGWASVSSFRKPTHLAFDNKKLQYEFRTPLGCFKDRAHQWNEITHMAIIKPHKTTNPTKYCLSLFKASKEMFRLPLGWVSNLENRELLSNAIETYLSNIPCDPEVALYLQPSAGHSFTEIWFQSLSEAPGRDKLIPLAGKKLLKKGEYGIVSHLPWPNQPGTYKGTRYKSEFTRAAGISSADTLVIIKEELIAKNPRFWENQDSTQKRSPELTALLAVKNSGIAPCVDVFLESDRGYLVFEEPKGTSLRAFIEKHPTVNQAVDIANRICDALLYLSMRKPPPIFALVSPDHVKIDPDGMPVLTDLKPIPSGPSAAEQLTGVHPGYLPPEFLKGQILPQSNVYAIGAVLFFLLTSTDPEPMSSSDPGLKRDGLEEKLRSLVSKATNPDAALRHGDYLALKAALADLQG
jgi:hypothetical protein